MGKHIPRRRPMRYSYRYHNYNRFSVSKHLPTSVAAASFVGAINTTPFQPLKKCPLTYLDEPPMSD